MAANTTETPAAPEPEDDDNEPIVATIDETGPVEPVAPANQVAVVEDVRVVEADEPVAEPAPAAVEPAPEKPLARVTALPSRERLARESYLLKSRELERAAQERLRYEQERLEARIREQLEADRRQLAGKLDELLEDTVMIQRKANDGSK